MIHLVISYFALLFQKLYLTKKIGEFPWLGFTLKGNEVHCGCSLLSPRWSISGLKTIFSAR